MKTKQINEESHESIQGQSYGNFLFRGQFLQRILQSHRREGEILNFVPPPGNTDDREPLKDEAFLKKIKGKLYADKGYISKQLTEILFINGIHLVTGIKSNMKNTLVELKDKILLRKRSVIETVNDELKTMCQIEHSRHHSFTNFLTNTLAAMIAYSFFPKKPAIKFEVETTNQLALF